MWFSCLPFSRSEVGLEGGWRWFGLQKNLFPEKHGSCNRVRSQEIGVCRGPFDFFWGGYVKIEGGLFRSVWLKLDGLVVGWSWSFSSAIHFTNRTLLFHIVFSCFPWLKVFSASSTSFIFCTRIAKVESRSPLRSSTQTRFISSTVWSVWEMGNEPVNHPKSEEIGLMKRSGKHGMNIGCKSPKRMICLT